MDDEARRDLLRRLFAAMTAKLEDAAGDAAEGQGHSLAMIAFVALAHKIRAAAEEAALLAEAAAAIGMNNA